MAKPVVDLGRVLPSARKGETLYLVKPYHPARLIDSFVTVTNEGESRLRECLALEFCRQFSDYDPSRMELWQLSEEHAYGVVNTAWTDFLFTGAIGTGGCWYFEYPDGQWGMYRQPYGHEDGPTLRTLREKASYSFWIPNDRLAEYIDKIGKTRQANSDA